MLRPVVSALALSTLWSTTALAQRPIHGTVTDFATGAAVGSARIVVKGTGIGAYSSAAGRFTMTVPDSAIALDVRRIGYEPVTVPVAAGQSEVAIMLKATAIELTEQVVTGQATSVSRRNLANDVTSVSAEDLTRTHTQTLENALQGKVPGAVITANSGAPGGGLQVRMRGVTSIFGNSQPLYVVDGVTISNSVIENGLNAVSQSAGGLNSSNQDNGVNRIADLNTADIESMDFLKGPSAAAIYGSSAANGVIIITTKRGTPGATRFTVSQRVGFNELANKIGERRFSLADAILYDSVNYIGKDTTLATHQRFGAAATTAMYQASGGFQDFEQQIFGDKSLSYETDLGISGGTEKTQYYVSGLEQHDNGIMYGTGYDKQGLRVNLTQAVGSRLQVRANANFVHTLTKRGFSNNDNVNVTPYFIIAAVPSFFSFQSVNGVYPPNPFIAPGTNILQTLALFSLPEDVFRFTGSIDATYTVLSTPTQTVKATLNAGLDTYSYKSNIYAPATLIWEASSGLPGLASDLNGSESQAPVALTLTHTFVPASNAFQATTSASLRSGFDRLGTTNVVTQNLLAGQQNVNLGTAVNVFENRQKVRTLSWIAQEQVLLLNERLFVSGGVVGQKSTNNADVNKLYYFPHAAGSYLWPTLGPFDNFKVRLAFGETGNEPLYGQKFTALTGLTYTGSNGVVIQGNLSDPNLHPEREREIEGGVDAEALQSRLGFSASVYQKNITDLILQAALAPSTGYATRVFNGGEIRNRGVEAAVTGFPVRTKDVSWSARVTFSKNTGVVLSLPASLGPACPSGPTCAFTPPNSFGSHFGQGFIQVGASPSQIYGRDTTGKRLKLGDYQPDFNMGISSEATYRHFRLYGLLEWRHGGSVVNLTQNSYDTFLTAPDSAASAERLRLFGLGASPYIQDASFVKLREVTLSYDLPEDLVRTLFGGRVTAVRAELSGHNLVTWTPYKGLDPEVSNFGIQNINRGQDVTPYPPSRNFFFSLSVDF
ncbi:MAG TPA: SusC/RagA family TonB-linked outer membrane protein [Gemmatimonadales bacterium]|nr:SusC/RagA family TonB-linked outer membrane protein [Gemmatimonadales bacterium]